MQHFFAPDLPASRRLTHIEACHKIALFEWLVRWAETVEINTEQFEVCDPMACLDGREPVAITIRDARQALVAIMSSPDADAILLHLEFQIVKLASALASWLGKPLPARLDATALLSLTDVPVRVR